MKIVAVTMEKEFRTFIVDQDLFGKNDTILLAVSGGVDSVVMADLFHQSGFHFGIAHCNFQLRGPESEQDEQFVKNLALKLGVTFHLNRFDTAGYAKQKGISIQMAARELRYEWFEVLRHQFHYNAIATAHHLDDQIETFFINLIRGTGISGLHGILPKQGKIIRPMMFAFRRNIESYASTSQIPFREDASNDSTKYLRNKIRHELLPLLREMNPDYAGSLTHTISRLRDSDQIVTAFINHWKEDVMIHKGDSWVIDLDRLRASEPQRTLAWELFSPFGFNESQVHNILKGLYKERPIQFFSKTHRAIKNRNQIILHSRHPETKQKPVLIYDFARKKSIRKPVKLILAKIGDPTQFTIPVSPLIACLDLDKLVFPLTLRKFTQGDTFYPLGMNKKKKLSDFFINQKLSLPEKENTWLLCSGNKIVWVIGQRIDHRFRITSRTEHILKIESV